MLPEGTPESVGLLPEPLQLLHTLSLDYLKPRNYGVYTHGDSRPLYPGAVVLIGHKGTIVSKFAVGKSWLYADYEGNELPAAEQISMSTETVFDIASVTKTFTTVLILSMMGKGLIDLDKPASSYLPGFKRPATDAIIVRHLLTHTSGLAALPDPPLFPGYTTVADRRSAILSADPEATVGSRWLYSDINFMLLGFLVEVSGLPQDVLLERIVTEPLGMKNTGYHRLAESQPTNVQTRWRATGVATEFQKSVMGPVGVIFEPPRRQPVSGSVHDENCWSLEGVTGHAGIFSTVSDLAIFAQMILDRGTYNGAKILDPGLVDVLFEKNKPIPEGGQQGIGFRLNYEPWCGALTSDDVAAHSGFVGTTLVIDRSSQSFYLHMSNRVHPERTWTNTNIARMQTGSLLARALGRNVKIPEGYEGQSDLWNAAADRPR